MVAGALMPYAVLAGALAFMTWQLAAADVIPVVEMVLFIVLAFGMVRAGLPEPAVYDGSWTEWASRPETIKQKSA